MTIAATPPPAIPAPTASLSPRAASVTPHTASVASSTASVKGKTASVTPETASGTGRRWSLPGGLTQAQTATAGAIVLAALALAGIGLYLSFEHVATFAHERLGFASLGKAQLFTVGVDVGILVLIALDLLMAWLRRPISWVRFPVWLLTGATIVLNAASAAPVSGVWTVVLYVAAFAHGIVPVLFIAVVEIGKTAIDRVVRPDTQVSPGVPLNRWLLAPAPTFGLWRRMKLWEVPTYSEAVARDQELRVYRVMLEREYGSIRKAPADLRLPLTMARYGLTVVEALALPQEAEERALALKEAKEAARIAGEARKAERAAQAEIARLKAAGTVQAARAEVEASTGSAQVKAAAEVAAAERAATVETEAIESATVAEAEARRAAAARVAAEDRKAVTEAEAEAAEAKRAATEALRRAAEAEAQASELKRRAAEDETARVRAVQDAAEAERRTAEARRLAAEAERAAVEAEDEARLTSTERAVRKVARLILARGGDVNAVSLDEVGELLQLKPATASERRAQAAALIASGYRP